MIGTNTHTHTHTHISLSLTDRLQRIGFQSPLEGKLLTIHQIKKKRKKKNVDLSKERKPKIWYCSLRLKRCHISKSKSRAPLFPPSTVPPSLEGPLQKTVCVDWWRNQQVVSYIFSDDISRSWYGRLHLEKSSHSHLVHSVTRNSVLLHLQSISWKI